MDKKTHRFLLIICILLALCVMLNTVIIIILLSSKKAPSPAEAQVESERPADTVDQGQPIRLEGDSPIVLNPEINGENLHFFMTSQNTSGVELYAQEVIVEDAMNGQPLGEPHHISATEMPDNILSKAVVPGQAISLEDNHPMMDGGPAFNERHYTIVFRGQDGKEFYQDYLFHIDSASPAAPGETEDRSIGAEQELNLVGDSFQFIIRFQNDSGQTLHTEEVIYEDIMNGEPLGEPRPFPASQMPDGNLTKVLAPGETFYFEDCYPAMDALAVYNERRITIIFKAEDGSQFEKAYYFDLEPLRELVFAQGNTVPNNDRDFSGDNGKDLALLRHEASFENETFPGVFWVPAVTLGQSRYSNAEVFSMLSDSPEQKREEISTLYEALQFYQIGDFRSADDNYRVFQNGVNWEYHTPGHDAVANNCGCCATDSAWLRYLLDGDYDEVGYISTSQPDGSGHIFSYIRDGEWFYIVDLTHYRNDWIATIEENGDMDAYMRSDRVLGNIHRTKDLQCFVDYVQSAFGEPPAIMFRLTCEDAPPIDGAPNGSNIAITHPESYESFITVIFDDPNDNVIHAYAPDPE